MNNLIIFFSVMLIVLSNTFSQWLPDIRITNDSARSFTCFGNSKAVAASGNFVHIIWFDERVSLSNREVFYKRSTDYGANFGPDIRLTDSIGASADPCIAVNGSNVHVVWKDNRNGNDEIYYKRSSDNGAAWGNDQRLTNAPSFSLISSISVSGSVIHAAWDDYRDNNQEIYYKRSTDGGITWLGDERLTNNTFVSANASVSSSGDNVYIVWNDSRHGNYEIFYKRSTDAGATWSADTRLTNQPGSSDDPCVSASGQNVHIVWKDSRDSGNIEIYYSRSSDGGLTWGADTRISITPGQTWYPSVSAAGQKVHIVFNDYTGPGRIYYTQSTNN